jgi:hypothetical protein
VKEKESVNIPQWLSLGAVVLGAVVLVVGFKKSLICVNCVICGLSCLPMNANS